jgi:hypothetical protein
VLSCLGHDSKTGFANPFCILIVYRLNYLLLLFCVGLTMQYLIIGNFGNHSVAVTQALIEKNLPDLHFVCVDTGWAASAWTERVQQGAQWAKRQGVSVHQIASPASFAEMVKDRNQFPSPKFQWCASFLKGLPVLTFLDTFDPFYDAVIVSGKRRQDSRRYSQLSEFEKENELYQRPTWYPLLQVGDEEFRALVKRTGLSFLPHQSLECSPCIHLNPPEQNGLDEASLKRLRLLEQEVGQTMVNTQAVKRNTVQGIGLHQFDRGCGASWGCGE